MVFFFLAFFFFFLRKMLMFQGKTDKNGMVVCIKKKKEDLQLSLVPLPSLKAQRLSSLKQSALVVASNEPSCKSSPPVPKAKKRLS